MPSPGDILRGHPPGIRLVAQHVREIIRDAVPEMKEKGYPGWRGIGYTHPKAGYVCAIFPHADIVKLGFEHGSALHDPEALLRQGPSQGKQVRYLEFRDITDVQRDVIMGFIMDAIRLKS